MTGRCDSRPDLAASAIPLEVTIPALAGGPLVGELFEPLGWRVEREPIALDPSVPRWGDSRYARVRLRGTLRLADALTHLYVLLPVLDDNKHYWVERDEIDKLLRAGGTWLSAHPSRELITRRYLSHARELVADALARLAEADDLEAEQLDNAVALDAPDDPDDEPPMPLAVLRRGAVLAALRAEGVHTVADVGCGEGALLRELIRDPSFTRVLGVDVSHRALQLAARRLRLDRMPDSQRARLELAQSSVTYRDDRLAGLDAVVLMEVIEHVDLPRLPALERSVFGRARPSCVVVTTPNAEHNVRYEFLTDGGMRHPDHRFEWTRDQFAGWAQTAAGAHGYAVRFLPVGADDAEVGAPTQMAVFRRGESA